MRNKSTKTKILKTLISLTLALSLLFTAQPTPVHAANSSKSDFSKLAKMVSVTENCASVNVNGQSVESNTSAGYLYYAGSEDRTGIAMYLVDGNGNVFGEPYLLCSQSMADEIYRAIDEGSLDNKMWYAAGDLRITDKGSVEAIYNIMVVKGADLRPVDYTDTWVSRGNEIKAWLTADSGHTLEDGTPISNWLHYTVETQLDGGMNNKDLTQALKNLVNEKKSWSLCVEPVSLNYLYTDEVFTCEYAPDKNRANLNMDTKGWKKGDPVPVGMNPDGTGRAKKVLGTPTGQMMAEPALTNKMGSQYTRKLFHGALPWSLCLSESQKVGDTTYNAPRNLSGDFLDRNTIVNVAANGIGLYVLKIECDKPPISTRFTPDSIPDGPNPPEPPEEPFTNGDCIIEKTYVSVSRNDDNEVEAAKVEAYEKQKDTTNKIHIEGNDNNSGYKLEAWAEINSPRGKTKANKTFNTENFKTHTKNQLIKSYLNGNVKNGSGDIEITKGNTLSLVYIKNNRADSKTLGYDFLLEESWLSKAFSFVPMDEKYKDIIASSHAAAEYHHNDFDTVNWAFIADCRK